MCTSDKSNEARFPVRSLTINGKCICEYVISYRKEAGGMLFMAAEHLQSYIRQTVGAELPICTECVSGSPRILIDETLVVGTDSIFKVRSDSDGIIVAGDAKRGVLYALFHFLEKFLGWRFIAADAEFCYEADSIDLSDIDYTFEHAYKIRDIYDYHYADPMISLKRYQNGDGTRGKMPEYGGTVSYCPNGIHTFHFLNENPEEKDQPCLNDPEVQQRFIKNIRKFLDERWDKQEIKSVHVSQNDNKRYCQCPACQADIDYYGAPSGSIIKMCNMIAEDLETYQDGRYKDVYIITFAYQYSLDCPVNIVCHPKVMVEYAIIDCCHQHALNDPNCKGAAEVQPLYTLYVRSNAEVAREMEKWSKICEHCYLYDYGANFRYYYNLFPDIDNLYENYMMLNKFGAWGYIVLCNVQAPSSEFGVLRDYLICKLTENHDMTKEEFEAHINEFFYAYYGPAREYARAYYDFTQQLSADKDDCFGVNNSPEQMFGSHAFAKYSDWLVELFDKAMQVEGLTEAQLLHVRWLRTSAEYLRLGAIHQTEMESGDPVRQQAQEEAVKAFRASLTELNQVWVDEWYTLPEEFNPKENVRTWINHTIRHQYSE